MHDSHTLCVFPLGRAPLLRELRPLPCMTLHTPGIRCPGHPVYSPPASHDVSCRCLGNSHTSGVCPEQHAQAH
eukprot:517746-Alexandrium_andersonii.AAC.1